MFEMKRAVIQPMMEKINKGREKLNGIEKELIGERDKKKVEALRTLYFQEFEKNKQTWQSYKRKLGKESEALFDRLEKGQGIKMLRIFKECLDKNFDEKQTPKKTVNVYEDDVLEWEEEKKKEEKPSSFELQGIFAYLVKKDARFMPFLNSQVEVKNDTSLGFEGHYEDPTPVYKKKMVIEVTDFNLKNHPILQQAKSILLTLQATHYDDNHQERDHVKPYHLYEEVKENNLEYSVTIVLNNGHELKIDRFDALLEEWETWSNEGSQRESVYAEAFKEWYLLSALEDYHQSMHDYYRHSALNGLMNLLEQKETKSYVLEHLYHGYVILTVHPTHGQILTKFHFRKDLSFLEPESYSESIGNLLYTLSLFDGKHLELFPSEEEQILLVETINATEVVPEEDKIWVSYKQDIACQYGTLKEEQVKEEIEKLKEITGKPLNQLLEENDETLVAFLLKLAVLLEANGQSGENIMNDDRIESFLATSLPYLHDEYVREVIALALERYKKTLIKLGIFKLN